MTIKSSDVLLNALEMQNISQRELAEKIGTSAQNINQKLLHNSLRADDFFGLLEKIGVEAYFRLSDSGIPVSTIRGDNPHETDVIKMHKGILYDTRKSFVLSDDFYKNGKGKYDDKGEARILYIDRRSRYFFVVYSENSSVVKIENSDLDSAREFIRKYGIIPKKTVK
ncbi:MAG: hypothetical protein Q4E34_00310 [Synergistaceae bacterium]|nr:hypothetical protein [Synergistaceae bacterium]